MVLQVVVAIIDKVLSLFKFRLHSLVTSVVAIQTLSKRCEAIGRNVAPGPGAIGRVHKRTIGTIAGTMFIDAIFL